MLRWTLLVLLAALAAQAQAQQQGMNTRRAQQAITSTSATPRVSLQQCQFRAYSPGTRLGRCELHPLVPLALPTEPTSSMGQLLLRVHARAHLCSLAANASACQGQAQGLACTWSDATQACSSRELAEWAWFTRHPYLSEAPAWLMCPGSQAAAYKACTRTGMSAAECTARPDCGQDPSTGRCAPAFLLPGAAVQAAGGNGSRAAASQPLSRDAWTAAFRAMEPGVFGTCETRCLLAGIDACRSPEAITSEPMCAAASRAWGCTWATGMCRPSMLGPSSDPWAAALAAAELACQGAASSQAVCEARRLQGLDAAGLAARARDAKDYQQQQQQQQLAADAAPAACSVQ